MLDWVLDALTQAGFRRDEIVFVCGYREETIRARYPELEFVVNESWASNNILLSLLCARQYLGEGFVSTYADIVYTPDVVRRLVGSGHDVVLGCDTAWRRRYVGRSQHPETDAEKLRAEDDRVVEIGRHIESERAHGEFIGVMKLSASGAKEFLAHFDAARSEYAGRTFRDGRSFEKAYLIDLLQHMLEHGTSMHRENTHGGYMEIDTLEDLAAAARWWNTRPDAG
jgi:choline kinase